MSQASNLFKAFGATLGTRWAHCVTGFDDFDDDEAKMLAKKLTGYPFRLTQAERLKEAIGYIEDFIYDESAQIIKEIIPSIGGML